MDKLKVVGFFLNFVFIIHLVTRGSYLLNYGICRGSGSFIQVSHCGNSTLFTMFSVAETLLGYISYAQLGQELRVVSDK